MKIGRSVASHFRTLALSHFRTAVQWTIDTADPRPIDVQIVDEVRRALVLGTLRPEDVLPPVRDLAAELRVNPGAVARAYQAMEAEGMVAVRWGEGAVVSVPAQGDAERRALARRVAERALRDARRDGVSVDELMEALREAADAAALPAPEDPR